MTADLTKAVKRCDICQQTRAALLKGPSMTYAIPNLPWQIVACDCFECDGSHCLIVVNLFSDCIDMNQLKSLSSATFDWSAQANLCGPWIHVTLISDNGPNNAFVEFSDFPWLEHPTYHIQSPSPTGKWQGWISSQDNEVQHQQSQQKKSRCMESYSRMGKLTCPISRQFPSPTPYVT